jgi:monoamine oxidase
MLKLQTDTLIIGGGLSGVYAATLLQTKQRPFLLLEARSHPGGRILSPAFRGYRSDMGPSWFWPEIHPLMARLIENLGLTAFRQYETGYGRYQAAPGVIRNLSGYVMEPESWRLEGGMIALLEALLAKLPPETIRTGQPVCRLEQVPDGIRVEVGELEKQPEAVYQARRVILALPPRLTASTILFSPELSPELTQGMLKTPTWMAGQAKFAALYEEPFWRKRQFSGQAFSQVGPMSEIHDGSNRQGGPYGLVGFLGLPAAARRDETSLQAAILEQLAEIFGPAARQPLVTFYRDWAREPFTATRFDQAPLREHPLYRPPAGQTGCWENRLLFAGTETSEHQGGYLEGALAAAVRAVHESE